MQCAYDVLLSCTLETYMVLQTNVTPINSIKKQLNLKYKTNKHTEQKQTYRYREQFDCCQVGGGLEGLVKK